ncbi:MAG: ATP synthase F1 subunit delta [Prolixibacteraceae bacterium]|jgi:F-type H+-transporting ATPase subunit delta|nr:ATP synthase F1 subunit delta [Prolixibacteraceae bacterium]
MDRNRITVRYAKALVKMASEQNITNEICNDFEILFQALNQYPDFEHYIGIPRISSSEKIKKVHSLFSTTFNKLSLQLIELVIKHQRENYLKDIARNIITYLHELQGIFPATLKTAQPLNKDLVDKIHDSFESKLRKTILLRTETDYRLIGGFVFTLNNIQYDASLATRLKIVQKQIQ